MNDQIKTDESNDLFLKNRDLNEEEFKQRKTILESLPVKLLTVLTNKCNLNCIMCSRVLEEASTLEYEHVKKIYPLMPYAERLNWQGGEVFILDYFYEAFEEACKYPNMKQEITTSVVLIDEQWAQKLASNNLHLVCSVDAVTKETYEAIRKGARYEDLLQSLSWLADAKSRHKGSGFFLATRAAVMKMNSLELDRFPEFCSQYDMDLLIFDVLYPDIAPEQDVLTDPDPELLAYLARTISDISVNCLANGMPFECTFNSILDANKEKDRQESQSNEQEQGDKNLNKVCSAPWKSLFIDKNGGVKPACECSLYAGNIKDQSLEEIWNGDTMQLYRRSIRKGNASRVCSDICRYYAQLERYEK